jgi:hypothetical protein
LVPEASNLSRIEPKYTPKGTQLLTLASEGLQFADDWTKKLWNNRFAALDDTVKEDGSDLKGAVPGAGAAPTAVGLGLRAHQKQATFFQGDFVKGDDKFWFTIEEGRLKVVDQIRNLFLPSCEKMSGNERLLFGNPTRSIMPSWSEANGRLVFRYDVDLLDISVQIPVQSPFRPEPIIQTVKATVEARLVVSCSSDALTTGQAKWRMESLEVLRGRRQDEQQLGPPGGAVHGLPNPVSGRPLP